MTTKREPPISIRIDKENLAKVKAAAALEGKTLSGFVKDAAVAAAEYRIQETAAASAGRSMERALTPATGVVPDVPQYDPPSRSPRANKPSSAP